MHIVRIILCDNHLPVVEAWRAYFGAVPDVEIACNEIYSVDAAALVVPINSFGLIDTGLEAYNIEMIGEQVQSEIQAVIQERHDGELLVGAAETMICNEAQFRFLVCTPTMRVAQNVGRTVNAYLAFRAALRAVRSFNEYHGDVISTLAVPGLCTANGFMPPLRSARQMRAAYDHVMFGAEPNVDISLDAGGDANDKTTVRKAEAEFRAVGTP